jgi:hypothetical protein
MELDQMAAPVAPTMNNLVSDGFAFGDRAVYDNEGNYLTGTWDTIAPVNEPINFDVLAQPTKPDISLLTTAMANACIAVREVSQDAAHNSWITNDSNSTTPNAWDSETPFVHNLPNANVSTVTNIGKLSRDVNVNTQEFWSIQAIGGYEAMITTNDYDASNASSTFGYRAGKHNIANPIGGVIIVFQETIRDFAVTGKDIDGTRCKRTANELNKLVTFHETLHTLGFVDPYIDANNNVVSPDGDIMNAKLWLYSENIDHVAVLNPEQIKKIQTRIDIQ